ncbi:MAPEG family protein [Flavobacterium sp. W21_SRS_FM6]|uniref:MAPEG family protein n=1 Tax=Flavobacterium sp. W21_SRS_FM6 TaxID=3240268 RepID=UPI003F8EC076
MNATIVALLGYIAWTLLLLVALAIYRTDLVMKRKKAPNAFKADGSDSPPFGQRLTRAQANCVESFAFIGGLLLFSLATNSTMVTNDFAYVLLLARFGQSISHLVSTSVLAVQIRFAFFLTQVAICLYWVGMFGLKFIGL